MTAPVSPLSRILAACSEMEEARAKATQEEWQSRVVQKEIYPGRWALYAGNKPTFINDPWDWTQKDRPEIKQTCDDADFICLAANRAAGLAAALKIACEALSRLEGCIWDEREGEFICLAESTLARIADLVEGK